MLNNVTYRFGIAFLFFFLLHISTVFSQGFKAGLIGGISTTQISGDQLSGFNKAGIVAGGLVSIELSQKFDLQMEIMYFQKGSRKNANPDKLDYTSYRLRLNYFEVPLLLEWKYSKRLSFEGGPTFGALLSSQEEDEYGELNISYPFKKFELGLAGGMNIVLIQGLIFNARYESSVLSVRAYVDGQTYRFNKGQYNTALVFSLRYKFDGKNKDAQ